jgi:flagellar hook-basal body complex protein FliE
MTIAPIGPVVPVVVPSVIAPPAGDDSTTMAGGVNFADVLGNSLARVQGVQNRADDLAVQAATGTLEDVHEYMVAATEASLTTQLTVAIRNKAVDAFNEIMRMQA